MGGGAGSQGGGFTHNFTICCLLLWKVHFLPERVFLSLREVFQHLCACAQQCLCSQCSHCIPPEGRIPPGPVELRAAPRVSHQEGQMMTSIFLIAHIEMILPYTHGGLA